MKYAVAILLALVLVTAPSASTSALRATADKQTAAAPLTKPKLVVLITVDQMRGDFIERYQQQWNKGLKRLVSEGAWFRDANYPYYITVTCAGHATIATGTVPAVHGMISNTWAVDNNARTASCTDDPTQKLISYGPPVKGVGHSAANLMSSTLADEIRIQGWPKPHVVGISLKARSAINLSGHKADAVIWLDDIGEWVTSTAFADAPAPYFADYIAKHPMRAEMARTWNRALPKEQYLYEDTRAGRRNTPHTTSGFPHSLMRHLEDGAPGITDAWEASPYSDEYLNGLAMQAIDALKLGRGAATDVLAISFSALDAVGHSYGPFSHEVQDVMVGLDRTIGVLLDKLDREVGAGRYVVALSADHGVAPNPEQMRAAGLDAGRIETGPLGRALDAVLLRALGGGPYRTRVIANDVYFNDGVYARLQQNPAAMSAILDTLRKVDGVARVYRHEELSPTDPLTRQAFLSHYEGRSGQILMITRPYWITSPNTATHGTGNRYDTHVPIVLFGYGIKKGEYLDPVAPIDIAPTLAFLAGVTLPNPMGRVLAQALTHP